MAASPAPDPTYRGFTGGLLPAYDGREDFCKSAATLPLDRVTFLHPANATGPRPFRTALLLLVALAAAVAALGTPATAEAAQPCWKRLINDWYDGRIDNAYPVKCYRQAIENLPEDVKSYSSAREDIRRALLIAIRNNGGTAGPNFIVPPQPKAPPKGDGGRKESPLLNDEDEEDDILAQASDEGPIGSFFDKIGPSSADAVPVPILILAGLAFVLLAAALASAVTRRVQARRVTVADGPRDQR
jgi:hypothetical protein